MYLGLGNGLLIALDAHTGGLLWTEPLVVAGLPATASALSLAALGCLLIGTTEGRVAECAVPARADLTAHPGEPGEGPVFRLFPLPPRPTGFGLSSAPAGGGGLGGGATFRGGGRGRRVQE
ncbi:hypothetical protein VSH64_07790 [Amycolatopsis rhabdoformis]|uniref:PQQ-binding-like beta-propeller repeat protein n=1 Tax=Amycolatopsis rhabdoformis TaxID=1448059 RepID=A0ABZ1IC08_9PSEU|nr:hypothetical protein [Amycolatopsis rhabdoformis]WSE32009.1 hypothetical protein VSH64_07790 [Amycolatopsis rhabdoformis]